MFLGFGKSFRDKRIHLKFLHWVSWIWVSLRNHGKNRVFEQHSKKTCGKCIYRFGLLRKHRFI